MHPKYITKTTMFKAMTCESIKAQKFDINYLKYLPNKKNTIHFLTKNLGLRFRFSEIEPNQFFGFWLTGFWRNNSEYNRFINRFGSEFGYFWNFGFIENNRLYR